MIRSRLSYARFYLRILTLVLPVLAYFIAVRIRFGMNLLLERHNNLGVPSYWGIVLLTTIAWAIVAEESGLWNIEELYVTGGKSRRLIEALAFTYAIVMVGAFLYRQVSYSRAVVALSAIVLFLLATALRIIFRVCLEWARVSGRSEIKILMVGTGAYASQVASALTHGQVLPGKIAGYVRLPDHPIEVDGAPVYELDHVPVFSNGDTINDVVIALPHERLDEIRLVLPMLERLCVPTRLAIDFAPGVGFSDRLIDLGGINMLDLRPTLAESGSYLVLKRSFDVILSLLVLSVTWPLMLIIALAIKFESEGPVLFSQDRVGLNGRVFRILKFRTMKMGSEDESDTRWTEPQDPRRTYVGAFLRRTNLDELPQFLNVLKGDMSVVGPRPERPFFVERFLTEFEKYNSRHFLKAGITGWAQVNGWRGDTSIAKRVEFDLYYLRNWSLTFDLQIITLTFLRLFTSKNAH
ncbi:MAG TPA: exopolysaccharide biosynthesis polyprenyl glycosylphosphotransferase [Candidatus Binatia bacterium]|nr:exopolysaccharide biosynthesis polyprenyl glycosylphosphotransferase [Candidatus Binatia bacterium]